MHGNIVGANVRYKKKWDVSICFTLMVLVVVVVYEQHVRILQVYATCHLLSDYAHEIRNVEGFEHFNLPSLILCGDFNCDENSGGHFLLKHKHITKEHIDWQNGKTLHTKNHSKP